MDLNTRNFDLAFRGFETRYNDGFASVSPHALDVAMQVTSVARDETYGWLGSFPMLREWLGQRVVHKLLSHSFTIMNRDFESTISISRNDFADDKLGLYGPVFSELGVLTAQHREELVFGLLKDGFTSMCYDGQNFFDTDHPLGNSGTGITSFSNMQAGSGPGWYLLDTARAVRPIIWQERQSYDLVAMDRPEDHNVFMNKQHLYGVDARVNAGFGLPQLAFASKADLTAANYAAARAAMRSFTNHDGRKLGIMPKVLVVPPSLEDDALRIVNTETNDGGGSNPYKGTADLIVSPFVGD